MDRPTQTQVFSWLEQRRGLLSLMHTRMNVADQWIHADEDPSPIIKYVSAGFPAGHQYQTFPYAWTVLNRGVNQIYTGEVPQVTYELPKEYHRKNAKAKEHERTVQAWAQGVVYHIATHSPENPFLDALYQQLGTGLGVLSYPIDYERWGTPPENRGGTPEDDEAWEAFELGRAESIPWRVTSLHPTWVFFDLSNSPPKDYIIERRVSLAEMATRFPKLGLDLGDRTQELTSIYREYVSESWYGCWVDGKPVTEHPDADDDGIAPNGLGHPWFQLAWSGLGKQDRDGSWERRGVGMIQRGISEFRGLTWDDNFMALIKRAMIPKYVVTGDSQEQAQEETKDFDPQDPAIIALSRAVSLKPLEPLDIPQALMQDVQQRQQRLEQIYGPGILSGENRSEPASKHASRLELARGPYRAPKKNIEQGVANMLSQMLWDVKYEPDLRDGVGVYYRKGRDGPREFAHLRPEDAVLGGKFTVDFSPLTPEDKAFKVEDAKQKQDAGWYSKDRAMKEGGEIEDTAEEQAQIMAEAIMESDAMVQFQTNLSLDRLRALLGLPPPSAPAMNGGLGAEPLAAEVVPGTPLPGVPQLPPPPLASDQEATEQIRSLFRLPQVVSGGGY